MLRGLDAIRKCANVVFICTTNFIANIDSAFLDRIFLREYVNVPGVNSIFEILRGELNGLLRSRRMTFSRMVYDETYDRVTVQSVPKATCSTSPGCSQTTTSADCHITTPSYIPDVAWAATHWIGHTDTVTSRLHAMAQRANGISGRRLQDLVEQARLKYTVDTPCDLRELLHALNRVIEQETAGPQRSLEEPPSIGIQKDMTEHHFGDIAALLARIDGDQAVGPVTG